MFREYKLKHDFRKYVSPVSFTLEFYNSGRFNKKYLTHLFPMHPCSTPWKHQKFLRFFDVFRGQRKGDLGTNRLRERDPTYVKIPDLCFSRSIL